MAVSATPMVLVDPTTGQQYKAGGGATGTQPSSNASSVTPATDAKWTVVDDQTAYAFPPNNGSSLAAGAATTPVTIVVGGSYIWSYILGGTSPSLVLEALGPDGTTYIPVNSVAVTATGAQGVVLGAGSTVRLRNSGANTITGLYSVLA